jgi:transposase
MTSAMTTDQPIEVVLTIGVDTHTEAHVAVASDHFGRRIGTCTLATTEAGYGSFLQWASQLGEIHTIGMEGLVATAQG